MPDRGSSNGSLRITRIVVKAPERRFRQVFGFIGALLDFWGNEGTRAASPSTETNKKRVESCIVGIEKNKQR